jgi:hypothetical protein
MIKRGIALVFVVIACMPAAEHPAGIFVGPEPIASEIPTPPAVPTGPLDSRVAEELQLLVDSIRAQSFDAEALAGAARGGDPRVAWFVTDLMRFFQGGSTGAQLDRAFLDLTGQQPVREARTSFVPAVNLLTAWDLPAWEGYDRLKRDIYTIIEPAWDPFFEENVSIDWRLVTWGGVLIDDRPLGATVPCTRGCIPALDDPPTVPADEVTWYADSDIVFGLVVNDEALALPKNQMEVHEMVNLTIGDRRLGIPYCTLCGSAQAFFTDSVPEPLADPILRTSGLLSRSNKMMYDLETSSVIDTFTGEARSGPLADAGVVLDQATVVASTWGEWKAAHPGTRILAEDGGVGRDYERDPLGDRDAGGPIFPTGPVDPRLGAHEDVVGIVTPDGRAVAFPVDMVREVLRDGGIVRFEDLEVVLDGDGLRVSGPDSGVVSHQAFWFAWSQFHPGTLVWEDGR